MLMFHLRCPRHLLYIKIKMSQDGVPRKRWWTPGWSLPSKLNASLTAPAMASERQARNITWAIPSRVVRQSVLKLSGVDRLLRRPQCQARDDEVYASVPASPMRFQSYRVVQFFHPYPLQGFMVCVSVRSIEATDDEVTLDINLRIAMVRAGGCVWHGSPGVAAAFGDAATHRFCFSPCLPAPYAALLSRSCDFCGAALAQSCSLCGAFSSCFTLRVVMSFVQHSHHSMILIASCR